MFATCGLLQKQPTHCRWPEVGEDATVSDIGVWDQACGRQHAFTRVPNSAFDAVCL